MTDFEHILVYINILLFIPLIYSLHGKELQNVHRLIILLISLVMMGFVSMEGSGLVHNNHEYRTLCSK